MIMNRIYSLAEIIKKITDITIPIIPKEQKKGKNLILNLYQAMRVTQKESK